MRKSIAKLPTPVLAGVVRETTTGAAIAQIKNCLYDGAIARDGNTHGHMTHLGEDGRMGDPKDITDTVLFLAQQDYITGQNIVVDGGRSLGPSHR